MKRIRLGVSIADTEFMDRFCSCLMRHYKELIELHIFSDKETLFKEQSNLDAVLVSEMPLTETAKVPVIYLYDDEDAGVWEEKEGVHLVDKYQGVNQIVNEILQQVGEEVQGMKSGLRMHKPVKIFAVYSLSETEYQLPFAVTLASIMGEKAKLLLLDLQENSGLSQLFGEHSGSGLEELLVMTAGEKCTGSRVLASIGHMDKVDYVYPALNSECLSETSATSYQKLMENLSQQLDYEMVVLNLGSRFEGFFRLIEACEDLYLLKGRSGLGEWRQKEFIEEMSRRLPASALERIHEIELPKMNPSAISCERLVETWKWDGLGDTIRRWMPESVAYG